MGRVIHYESYYFKYYRESWGSLYLGVSRFQDPWSESFIGIFVHLLESFSVIGTGGQEPGM